MSYCTKCGRNAAEGDLYCTACGTKLKGVRLTEEKAPVISTEEPRVKAERGKMDGVAKWAIVSAVVGALCGVAAAPLGVIGLNQQYDLVRYFSWANGTGGLPSGTAIAATVLGAVSVIFISVAIGLGIYALRSARKE